MIAAALGWAGTIGTFFTYVMVSRGRMTVSSVRYASLNAVGGTCAGTASALYGAWPSAAANFAWSVVALHTLSLCVHRRLRQSSSLIAVVSSETSGDGDGKCDHGYVEPTSIDNAIVVPLARGEGSLCSAAA
ncbi:hypothetical protein [Rhodococcus koreensis]